MVCPNTKWEPSSRIAWRVAVRTAGRPSRLIRLSRMVSGVSPGWMMRAVMPNVQAEAETRKVFDFTSWDDQSPAASLSSISRSAGGGIGHPQQRLRQHHQGEPLLGGQRIGMQKVLDPAEAAGLRPDALDQPGRARVDARFRRRLPRRLGQELGGGPPRRAAHRAR